MIQPQIVQSLSPIKSINYKDVKNYDKMNKKKQNRAIIIIAPFKGKKNNRRLRKMKDFK